MQVNFSFFCSCGQREYALLRKQIDTCAPFGRSYEFPGCHMPEGCHPAETTVGFWNSQGSYQIYFRPAVSYAGRNPKLKAFFQASALKFRSFEALVLTLITLGEGECPPPKEKKPRLKGYQTLEKALGEYVVGQEHAVEAVAFKLYSHMGKKNPTRPLSLIFYGPTGVGKSELGKSLLPVLNREGKPYQFIWTELNTFTEAHSAYRLTGAPPGYAGYEDKPIFEAVRKNPYTIFMFDELEKAHPEVLKVFMSILDEGRCSAHREDDQQGRELDFRHCILLFTTNADLSRSGNRPLGFSGGEEKKAERSIPAKEGELALQLFREDESAREALVRSGVLKEIAGRFSGLIGFQTLDRSAKIRVTEKQIMALGQEYGLRITRVSSEITQELTPEDALSLRSTVGILEGVLTPVFLSFSGRWPESLPFHLEGTVETPNLVPQERAEFLPCLNGAEG